MPWPTRARRALPLLGIVAASSALAAMESDDNPFLEPVPVVLTVSRLSQPLAEAPAAVTVLDRELILRSGARTLAEVLRLVPGFLVASNEYGAPVAYDPGPIRLTESSDETWGYRLRGDREVQPQDITDDGIRTRIIFAPEQSLPAIFAIGPTGDEQVVDGYMRDGIFVIDRVWEELVFRIDKEKATARRNREPESSDG